MLFRVPFLDKAVIILSWHHDINVIIPRNEAFVANRTEERAVGQRVSEPILRADSVDLIQNILLNIPKAMLYI